MTVVVPLALTVWLTVSEAVDDNVTVSDGDTVTVLVSEEEPVVEALPVVVAEEVAVTVTVVLPERLTVVVAEVEAVVDTVRVTV